jgi:hypothetical protein
MPQYTIADIVAPVRRPSGTLAPLAAALCIAALPALVTAMAVWFLLDARFEHFRPVLNDEVYYWHQIATFAKAGTNGGIYSIEEQAAPFFRFGMHGPFFPMLYGSLAGSIGWYRHSAPLFNLAWLGVATLTALALARPAPRYAAIFAVALATFWPLPFWAATGMQESFHHGVGIIVGGALAAVIAGRRPRAALAVAAIALIVASLVRPSWALLLPVVGGLAAGPSTRKRDVAAGMLLAAVVGAGLVWIYARVVAPDPGGFAFLRMGTLDTFTASARDNIAANVRRLQDVGDDFDGLELLHRAEYLYIVMAAALSAVALTVRRRGRDAVPWLIHLVNVGGIAIAMVTLYQLTNQTEYRIVSGHLLATVVALLLAQRRLGVAVAGVVVVANIAAAGLFADSFRDNRTASFGWDPRPLRVFEEVVAPRLRYDPQAPAWCNTMLTSEYPPEFIAVPPGIGISFIREWERQRVPLRSRYLFLDELTQRGLGDHLHGQALVSLPTATLFLNADADCPQ